MPDQLDDFQTQQQSDEITPPEPAEVEEEQTCVTCGGDLIDGECIDETCPDSPDYIGDDDQEDEDEEGD